MPIGRPGQMGGTPLHHAAWWGHGEVVEALLARGADAARAWPSRASAARRSAGPRTARSTPPARSRAAAPTTSGSRSGWCRRAPRSSRTCSTRPRAELAEWLPRGSTGGAEPRTRADYAELEHAAHAAYLAALPGAERIEVGDGFAVRTGVDSNSENGVVCSALDGDPAEVIAWLGGAPAQWLRRRGSDLHDRLVAAGCRPERTAVVMGARLAALDLGEPEGEPAGGDEYRAVAEAVDFGAGAVGAQQRSWRAGTAARSAIVGTFMHGDTAVVLDLAVLPEHRRQGIGRALLARALERAGAHVVLGPTPDSIPFYRRLGFELRPALRDRCFYLP